MNRKCVDEWCVLGGLSVRDPFSVLLLEMLELFDSDFFLFFFSHLNSSLSWNAGLGRAGNIKRTASQRMHILQQMLTGKNVQRCTARADRGRTDGFVAEAAQAAK